MKQSQKTLLHHLTQQVQIQQTFATQLKSLSDQQLNTRPHAEAWSILECVQHLNSYAAYYHPEIERRMSMSTSAPTEFFKSGWLGNYFAESMLPKEKLNKMNTPKAMNPINSQLDRTVIDEFLTHQEQLLQLLATAQTKNITKIRTSISLTPLLKIRLGDTFRFVINHNIRHSKQMEALSRKF